MYQLFSCSIASWHEEFATSTTALPTSLSRFVSVFAMMLGRFKSAKNLLLHKITKTVLKLYIESCTLVIIHDILIDIVYICKINTLV